MLHIHERPRWLQVRPWDDLVILTTLFHLFAMSHTLPWYSVLIATSTAASVAWHRANEADVLLAVLDYGIAGLWFVTDASLDWRTIPLNLGIAAANMAMENHAVWHLLSAAKATAVTHLLLTR